MNRATLIKLIHVARRELQLDEETYRAALMKVCADKTSCREMTVPELVRVLHVFQQKGFRSLKSRYLADHAPPGVCAGW